VNLPAPIDFKAVQAELSNRIQNKGYYNVALTMADGSILPYCYKAGKKKEKTIKPGSVVRAKATRSGKEERFKAVFVFRDSTTATYYFQSIADIRQELLTSAHHMLANVSTEQKQGLANWVEVDTCKIFRSDCIMGMAPNKIPEYVRPKHTAFKKKTCGFGGPNKLRWVGKASTTHVTFSHG
jgi:hypothetical protein